MKRRTRTLLIIVGIAVVLAVVVVANLKSKPAGEEVETTVVRRGSILSLVSATGELRARAQVNLQAQVMGVVERLLVKEGDWVERGQVLLELDRKSYEANLVLARSRFTQARLAHARVESLYTAKLVSAEAWEASRAAFEAAQAQYEQAQDQYDKTVIRAPIAGTVVQVNLKEGETVIIGTMNNIGTVMMVIADMSQMQAIVDVDETDVVDLVIGQAAEVEVDALPDRKFPGRVTHVGYMPVAATLTAASTTQGTVFEVEVTLDTTGPELRPGMSVKADITTASLDSVPVLPISAVGRRKVKGEEVQTVFVVQDGKSVLRPVETGKSSDVDIEITSGLELGDTVITGPYKVLSKLKEGRRVNAEPAKPDTADAAGSAK
jgi:HlyD family secretion protein